MHSRRPISALDPRRFGRAQAIALAEPRRSLAEDFQLFAATFAGGFVFVSILLA